MNKREAKEKAAETLTLAAETDDPKQAQAIATISTHWLAIAVSAPEESSTGMTPEGYV